MKALLNELLFILPLALFSCAPVHPWPPEQGETYPDLELFDESGSLVHLREFQGKVILVEAVRMPCPASQSFNSAQRWGSFGAVLPQAGVPEIEKLLSLYARTPLRNNPDFIVLEIIYFNMSNQPPTTKDLREWREHFHLHERNIIVLGAKSNVVDDTARTLVPGFQLIDRGFILRADSAGSNPRDDLYSGLLPKIATLITEKR